jgi:hypothetical protein
MRKIYENGQKIGADPLACYVYLWRAGDTDRYVGRGDGKARWNSHLRTSRNDHNQRKMRYFRRYKHLMTCYITEEGLTIDAVGPLEIEETKKRGIRAEGGPLLNDRHGSVAGPRTKGGSKNKSPRILLWEAQPDFPLEATFRLLSTESPWPPNKPGREFYNHVLAHGPKTVRDIIERGKVIGFTEKQIQEHLRWGYTWVRKGPQFEIDGKIHEVFQK